MMKHLKMIGLAAVAAMALAASLGAGSASATTFTAESFPVNIAGTQTTSSSFTTNAGTITCAQAHFTGTQAAASATSQTVEVSYTECKFLGIFNVTVNMAGCDYKLFSAGTVNIECKKVGELITFEAVGCKVSVGAQNGLSAIAYKTIGTTTTREITVEPNVTGISYHTGTGCPNGGTVNKSDGTYKGGDVDVTATSEATGKHVGLFTS
jgi:hypothetical protein